MGFEVRAATAAEFAAVGEITAAGYRADGLLAQDERRADPYESKLLDAAQRAVGSVARCCDLTDRRELRCCGRTHLESHIG